MQADSSSRDRQTLLVVDDEPSVRSLLTRILSLAGYDVATSADGATALASLEQQAYDLVLLDVVMPGMSGFDLCRRIRQFSQVPIIFLTGRIELEDELAGLEAGGDDYIVKPFRPPVMVARVRAVLRRARRPSEEPAEDGPVLEVEPREQQVWVGGQRIQLAGKEYELLAALAESANSVVGRGALVERVWGDQISPDSRTLDMHVSRLRRKLESADLLDSIRTMRGEGYALHAKVRWRES